MAKTKTDLVALADKVVAASTLGKVAMASALIQMGKVDVAETVLEAALDDLRATRLLGIVRAPLMNARDVNR